MSPVYSIYINILVVVCQQFFLKISIIFFPHDQIVEKGVDMSSHLWYGSQYRGLEETRNGYLRLLQGVY